MRLRLHLSDLERAAVLAAQRCFDEETGEAAHHPRHRVLHAFRNLERIGLSRHGFEMHAILTDVRRTVGRQGDGARAHATGVGLPLGEVGNRYVIDTDVDGAAQERRPVDPRD